MVHIRDMPARAHYAIMRRAVMAHFSAPTLRSEGPVKIPTQPKLHAFRGDFIGIREGQPWHFSLTTVNYGYWSGRMTVAYPQNQAIEAESHLTALLAGIRLQQPKVPSP
ncbi:MAG: hypothetical protein V4472_10645 [Pseudomonadota bacterium]